ncbi:MAG: dUTP diphosphatase [Thermoanaerobaculum sp.]|nr:dUTP diphosphatase [Thermoanaerobaculum sp.]MDW7968446.1 dUTP diphosphatase [Thermoanaerobaculum sp.]
MSVAVQVEVLPHGEGLPLPAYATAGASGADVCAAVQEDVVIPPGGRVAIPTGLRFAIPAGYEVQVRPRSGLALAFGVTVANAPGTVDSDYRGELKVILVNLGSQPFTVRRGDRVAQLVLAPVLRAVFLPAEGLPETARGVGGFGSTGV